MIEPPKWIKSGWFQIRSYRSYSNQPFAFQHQVLRHNENLQDLQDHAAPATPVRTWGWV
jgi:hypothetical protein